MRHRIEYFEGPVPVKKVQGNFIGRVEALRTFIKWLTDSLREPGRCVLLIIGTSSVGKTSFVNALRAAGGGVFPKCSDDEWSKEWRLLGKKGRNLRWLYFSFREDRLQYEADFWERLYEQLEPEKVEEALEALLDKSKGDWEHIWEKRAEHFKSKVLDLINPERPVILFLDEVDVIHERKEAWVSKQDILSNLGEALAGALQQGLLLVINLSLPPKIEKFAHESDPIYDDECSYDEDFPFSKHFLKQIHQVVDFRVLRLNYAEEGGSLRAFAEETGHGELGELISKFLTAPHMFPYMRFMRLLEDKSLRKDAQDRRKESQVAETLWESLVKYGKHLWDWIWDQLTRKEREEVYQLVESGKLKSEGARKRLYDKALLNREGKLIYLLRYRELWLRFFARKGYYGILSVFWFMGLLLIIVSGILLRFEKEPRWLVELLLFVGFWWFFGSLFQTFVEEEGGKEGTILFAFILWFLFLIIYLISNDPLWYTLSMVLLLANIWWIIEGLSLKLLIRIKLIIKKIGSLLVKSCSSDYA